MKTMKNVLMILLGAALVLSLAGVGAVAADTLDSDGAEGFLHVLYTVSEGYSVTIPTEVTVPNDGAPGSSNIELDATLNEDQTLTVTVTSQYGWKMCLVTSGDGSYGSQFECDETKNVTYTVNGVTPVGSYMVFEVTGADAADVTVNELKFVKTDDRNATVAGNYVDKLTFTLSVAE